MLQLFYIVQTCVCRLHIVGSFLPEGGIFAGKNRFLPAKIGWFLPAKIGLCQNWHQSKLEP